MTTPMPAMRMQLPGPRFPMVTRVISNALFPAEGSAAVREPEPIAWMIGTAHPFVPTMRIVRMFVVSDGVAIYSAADGAAEGMRNLIPMHWVRFVEEAMPIDIFVDELALAEEGEPEKPEESPNDPDSYPPLPHDGVDGNSALT